MALQALEIERSAKSCAERERERDIAKKGRAEGPQKSKKSGERKLASIRKEIAETAVVFIRQEVSRKVFEIDKCLPPF